jgi:hypothetical protein
MTSIGTRQLAIRQLVNRQSAIGNESARSRGHLAEHLGLTFGVSFHLMSERPVNEANNRPIGSMQIVRGSTSDG